MREIVFAGTRTIIPNLEMNMTLSVLRRQRIATTRPLRSVVRMSIRPLPPRL